MDVLMKVLYNGPRMRNCTFLGQQILFVLFLRRLLWFFLGWLSFGERKMARDSCDTHSAFFA